MKKLNATLSLMTFVLASLTFGRTTFAQQPPANVQGNWTIYSTRIDDGSIEIKHVQIAQYGNRITGYFGRSSSSGPIQGEVTGNHPPIQHRDSHRPELPRARLWRQHCGELRHSWQTRSVAGGAYDGHWSRHHKRWSTLRTVHAASTGGTTAPSGRT